MTSVSLTIIKKLFWIQIVTMRYVNGIPRKHHITLKLYNVKILRKYLNTIDQYFSAYNNFISREMTYEECE